MQCKKRVRTCTHVKHLYPPPPPSQQRIPALLVHPTALAVKPAPRPGGKASGRTLCHLSSPLAHPWPSGFSQRAASGSVSLHKAAMEWSEQTECKSKASTLDQPCFPGTPLPPQIENAETCIQYMTSVSASAIERQANSVSINTIANPPNHASLISLFQTHTITPKENVWMLAHEDRRPRPKNLATADLKKSTSHSRGYLLKAQKNPCSIQYRSLAPEHITHLSNPEKKGR